MRIAIINPVSQTPPSRWKLPHVVSNRQSIGVQLGRAIDAEGHTALVIMSDAYRPKVSDEGCACAYLPTRAPWAFLPTLMPWLGGLGATLKEFGPDLVVTSEWFQPASVQATAAKRSLGFTLMIWQELDRHQRILRTIPSRAYHATFGRWVSGVADLFLPRSESAAQFLRAHGVPANRVGPIIPNGADSTVFRPQTPSDDRPTIVCVGSLVEKKRPDFVIEALSWLVERGIDARAVLKGSGPMEPKLRMLVEQRGLGDRVQIDTMRADHDEIARLYARAWVALFPSVQDLATLSPVEAAMCGIPVVISSRISHASELEHLGVATVVHSDDPGDYAHAMESLLAAPSPTRLGEATVAQVVNDYSIDGVARKLIALYSRGNADWPA